MIRPGPAASLPSRTRECARPFLHRQTTSLPRSVVARSGSAPSSQISPQDRFGHSRQTGSPRFPGSSFAALIQSCVSPAAFKMLHDYATTDKRKTRGEWNSRWVLLRLPCETFQRPPDAVPKGIDRFADVVQCLGSARQSLREVTFQNQ